MFSLSHNNYTELSGYSISHSLPFECHDLMAKFTIKSTSVKGPVISNGELNFVFHSPIA
jgi:hypothetical protein